MTGSEKPIDYTPLKHFSSMFKIIRNLRRARMIIARLVFVGLVLTIIGFLLWAMNQPLNSVPAGDFTISFRSNDTFGLWVFLILVPVVATFFIPTIMYQFWANFAAKNNFRILSSNEKITNDVRSIPSFKDKFFSYSLGVIAGTYTNMDFALFTRNYKEGGVLRWRERQMDSILTLIVPANLPHIVINARANERARQSNLSASYPREHRFRFEGVYGDKYDVYTEPASRIVTLQLFTPDVLAVLYERLPAADIELKGNKIWIIQRYGVLDDTSARRLFEASGALYKELEKQIESAGLFGNVSHS